MGHLADVLVGSQTAILAAGLKSTKETVEAFLAGAQHVTVPFDLLASLSSHPLSEQTVEQFDMDGIGIRLTSSGE